MDYGEWTDNSRGTYNKWDGIARSTIQVCFDGILPSPQTCIHRYDLYFLSVRSVLAVLVYILSNFIRASLSRYTDIYHFLSHPLTCSSPVQVYPGAWTAILISLDNVGVWNIRTENLDSWYLGQETYVRVVNPEATNKTELPMPDNALFCGALSKFQKYGNHYPFQLLFCQSLRN